MTKKELIKNMVKQLDWMVQQYREYQFTEDQKIEHVEKFTHYATSYNLLLVYTHPSTVFPTFEKELEKYATDRKAGKYENGKS